jgi:hypothetical protein
VPVITVAQRVSDRVCEIKFNSSHLDMNLRALAFTISLSMDDLVVDSIMLACIAQILRGLPPHNSSLRRQQSYQLQHSNAHEGSCHFLVESEPESWRALVALMY